MLKILYKNKKYIVISKPAGIPAQSDLSGDVDVMSMVARNLEENGESSDLWLVHRLDRVVGGTMVFARNKHSAAELSSLVGGNGMEKEYLAVLEGDADDGTLVDHIYKDPAKGKAFVVDRIRKNAKEAILEYTKIASVETDRGVRTLVQIKLRTGRFHQIRVQFASRKLPLVGDGKYGSRDNKAKMPALYACRLAFNIGEERVVVSDFPNTDDYPWNLFKEYIK